jgi:nucleotide-binding universal stress UspA family protein
VHLIFIERKECSMSRGVAGSSEVMKILIGHDGSDYADAALDDLKRAGLPERVEALVVTVGEVPVVVPLPSQGAFKRTFDGERVRSIVDYANRQATAAWLRERNFVRNAAARLSSHFPSWQIHSEVVGGRPANELIRKAREWNAGMVVVGTQGRSALGRLILGSVSQEVVTDASCSVRVGRNPVKAEGANLRVLVGLDHSLGAEVMLRRVLQRSWPVGTELRVVSGDDVGTVLWRSDAVFQNILVGDLIVSGAAVRGDTQEVLLAEASRWEVDCIVVGSGLSAIVANAECSVEIIR